MQENAVDLLNRAVAALQTGAVGAARGILHRLLLAEPAAGNAHAALAYVALSGGERQSAVLRLRRALAIDPLHAAHHANLAAFGERRAAHSLRRALALAPGAGDWHSNYAVLYETDSRRRWARCRRALALSPGNVDAMMNLGLALCALGRAGEAVAIFRTAARHRRGSADLHFSLSGALADTGAIGAGLVEIRRALALAPDDAGIWTRTAKLVCLFGNVPSAATASERSIAINPAIPSAHSNRIMIELYDGDSSPEKILALTRRRGWPHRATPPPTRRGNTRSGARLRLAYVSADFWNHPIAYNIAPIIAAHDRRRVHVTCYADVIRRDEMTARVAQSADLWVETTGLDDAALAERIDQDGIDVLIILAGHTADNRLALADHRPAPTQLSLLDVATSGATAIDGILVDPLLCPPGTAGSFSERLLHVTCLFCFALPENAPQPSDPPQRPVTFGSFSNPAKLGRSTIALWAPLLRAAVGSKLVLKYKNLYGDPDIRAAVQRRFAAAGVDPGRLEFLHDVDRRSHHLQCYETIDIALDPTPFNGCTTTFEALWMGVPVLTAPSDRMIGRMGASILTAAGLADLVAADAQDFLRRGLGLVADKARRRDLRRELRRALADSRLTDGRVLAGELETVFEAAHAAHRRP